MRFLLLPPAPKVIEGYVFACIGRQFKYSMVYIHYAASLLLAICRQCNYVITATAEVPCAAAAKAVINQKQGLAQPQQCLVTSARIPTTTTGKYWSDQEEARIFKHISMALKTVVFKVDFCL